MVAAEKEHGHLTLQQPPPPERYHWSLLSLAHSIFEQTGQYITNPRTMTTGILYADTEWLSDFANYRKTLAFYRDYDKRPPEMR